MQPHCCERHIELFKGQSIYVLTSPSVQSRIVGFIFEEGGGGGFSPSYLRQKYVQEGKRETSVFCFPAFKHFEGWNFQRLRKLEEGGGGKPTQDIPT